MRYLTRGSERVERIEGFLRFLLANMINTLVSSEASRSQFLLIYIVVWFDSQWSIMQATVEAFLLVACIT